jgi:hypothetical protein
LPANENEVNESLSSSSIALGTGDVAGLPRMLEGREVGNVALDRFREWRLG